MVTMILQSDPRSPLLRKVWFSREVVGKIRRNLREEPFTALLLHQFDPLIDIEVNRE